MIWRQKPPEVVLHTDPSEPMTGPRHIHLWVADLDHRPAGCGAPTLDPDERARAARLREYRSRSRFVARHALLREVLGTVSGVPPSELRFTAPGPGKPRLSHPREVCAAGREIDFSLSSTEGVAAVAVSRGGSVGVDIEIVRPLDDPLGVARAALPPHQLRRLESSAPPGRGLSFYRDWTRLEARAKIDGSGLVSRSAGSAIPGSVSVRSFALERPGELIVGAIAASARPIIPARWEEEGPVPRAGAFPRRVGRKGRTRWGEGRRAPTAPRRRPPFG